MRTSEARRPQLGDLGLANLRLTGLGLIGD